MSALFTAKRDEDDYLIFRAIILEQGKSISIQFPEGFESVPSLKERMHLRYGDDSLFLPPSKFYKEVEERQIHTPELLTLLKRDGELLGQDLTSHVVYGSPFRPMDSVWARIDGAVYIRSDKQQTGFHTYVAVPTLLEAEVVNRYELQFVSRPEGSF